MADSVTCDPVMADSMLYYFWLVVTSLFVFSGVYSWFVAIVVRKALPGELAWVYFGLAWITGGNAFVRSGQQVIDQHVIMGISRSMWLLVGISSVAAAIMLGVQYNGEFSKHVPLSQQWSMLKRSILRRERERDDESTA